MVATIKWTVEQYHKMTDLGIISANQRTELIDGEIILMAAKKPPHIIVSKLAADYLQQLLSGRAVIWRQDSIQLDDHSEPEPDITVLRPPLRSYVDRLPRAEDVILVIEVADATLKYDLTTKAKSYAASDIQEYWVIDAINRTITQFTNPVGGEYQVKEVFDGESDLMPIVSMFPVRVGFANFFEVPNV